MVADDFLTFSGASGPGRLDWELLEGSDQIYVVSISLDTCTQ